ncbi:hypothetical protein LSCM1_03190 [Leishmania martiniquensis]|uniref:Uncharacterized protein n=1 Tax=Leishmania martiniquensis TaxID=1580590 RepID=A0A836H3A5_9TRYP|nr:hypothetical protein LSCM1_03190 [Leishmania martiniquensis]
MLSSDVLARARAPADTMAAEEAAAIAASYARGHSTTYYVDCTRLPSSGSTTMGAALGNTALSTADDREAPTASLLTLGDFSMLPHPEYVGRRGKTFNKPLYLHHLKH